MLFRQKWRRKQLSVPILFNPLFIEATAFKKIPRLSYHYILRYSEIKKTIESLTVGEKSCNEPSITTLAINKYPNLKTIDLCNSSFTYVNRVTIERCPLLTLIHIGRFCFTTEESDKSLFCIKDCPVVKKIHIHYRTFVAPNTVIMQSIDWFPWLFGLAFFEVSSSIC